VPNLRCPVVCGATYFCVLTWASKKPGNMEATATGSVPTGDMRVCGFGRPDTTTIQGAEGDSNQGGWLRKAGSTPQRQPLRRLGKA
jgi:hypothetical protein